jgi:hypothetical protein
MPFWFGVMVGGVCGALARYGANLWVVGRLAKTVWGTFPLITLLANVVGSFLLALRGMGVACLAADAWYWLDRCPHDFFYLYLRKRPAGTGGRGAAGQPVCRGQSGPWRGGRRAGAYARRTAGRRCVTMARLTGGLLHSCPRTSGPGARSETGTLLQVPPIQRKGWHDPAGSL